jgi:hypothetical protein
MTPSPRAIRANAERLHELHQRTRETFKHRSRSGSDHEAWSRSCADFHRQFDELSYPGGTERWLAFMKGDTSEVEVAINYLEADPWHFRSGYQKETIWNRLKKSYLQPRELLRLEQITRGYLPRRAYRHFWYMVRFVRLRAGESFWSDVEQLSLSETRTPESVKATWLVCARANLPVQQWISHERWQPRWKPGYVPNMDFLHRHEA